jgi:hypothetical protein
VALWDSQEVCSGCVSGSPTQHMWMLGWEPISMGIHRLVDLGGVQRTVG